MRRNVESTGESIIRDRKTSTAYRFGGSRFTKLQTSLATVEFIVSLRAAPPAAAAPTVTHNPVLNPLPMTI